MIKTTSGVDGKILVWNVESGKEARIEKMIEGVIPKVVDPSSVLSCILPSSLFTVFSDRRAPEFLHDCSAVWHTSGQYFFTATRAQGKNFMSMFSWT